MSNSQANQGQEGVAPLVPTTATSDAPATPAPTANPSTQQPGTKNNNHQDDDSDEEEVRKQYPKVKMPDPYDGNRGTLIRFLAQVNIYLTFNDRLFEYEFEKVLWTGALLRGSAFDWFSPFLIDYTRNKNAEGRVLTTAKEETKRMFCSMDNFADGLSQVFGDIDQDQNATRSLLNLKQKGSAAHYTATFQQHAIRVNWNDDSLRAQYYKGLKDVIKDEMARSDRPENLGLMMEMAIRIDNRMYERTLERKGYYEPKKSKAYSQPKSRWPEPMELDATRVGNRPSKEEMDKRRKEGLCFECGKTGHQAKSHRKNQGKKPWKGRTQQLKATRLPEAVTCSTAEQEHACLSWTACYNDNCLVHRSEKDGSGWYPKRPKNKKARKAQDSEDSE